MQCNETINGTEAAVDYQDFLDKKQVRHDSVVGFEVDEADINPMLFDWQRQVVRWAAYKGQAALFEACGLGKTPQQIESRNRIRTHRRRCPHLGAKQQLQHRRPGRVPSSERRFMFAGNRPTSSRGSMSPTMRCLQSSIRSISQGWYLMKVQF